MATIRFVDNSERKFKTRGELMASGHQVRMIGEPLASGEAENTRFTHHPGSDSEPELFEARLPPGRKVDSHAHDSDEIMVVTEGEIQFGRQVFGVGSSIFIPKMTLYSFQAGPEGLTFLNFRPHKGDTIPKDEYMALRN